MRRLILLLMILVSPAGAEQADLLLYEVHEPGLPGYRSRILVTDAFVRLDEGEGSTAGYTLYNRVSRLIYNVDPEEETVLVLTPSDRQPAAPRDLQLEARRVADPGAPKVAGQVPLRIELHADGELCRTLQVIQGTMERALQGLRELRLALARLGQEPAEPLHLSACERAEFIYAPTRALDHGLPLADLMPQRQQWLVEFGERREVGEGLFEVPLRYEQVVPPALDGR